MSKFKGIIYFFILIICLDLVGSLELSFGIEEWENKWIDWYYDNLDDEDRRKIRQAMDYLIPRSQIIDSFYQGLAVPLSSEVGQNIIGYDVSVQPREYNETKAAGLLTEVFGKTYNKEAERNSATETNIPYFSMVLVCPTTNGARAHWISLIALAFTNAGIDVELKWWNWNQIISRIYLDPSAPGFDYAHGGVDAWLIDQNSNPDPDYSTIYYKNHFSPAGDNAFWCESQEVTDIINKSLTAPDLADRLEALSDFQHWFYDEVPKSIICQEIDVFAIDENLQGFDPYLVGRGWCFNNWTIGNQTTMTYTVPGDFVDFNSLLSNNYYDMVPLANIVGGLTQRRGAYNLTHPVPQIAESWTSNENGTIWEVKIRDGIKWDDGNDLTAEDVLFSFHAVFEDDLASPNQGFYLDRFPNNASDIHLKDGTNDTIVFKLGGFYPYVTTQVLSRFGIIQKAQWENIPYSDWKTHPLNTGTGTEYIKGCGPYMMTNYNISTGMVLEINPFFDQDVFGHDPDANGGGVFFTNPTLEEIRVVVVIDATTAIAGLASGIYDAIDSQTGLQARYEDLNAPNNEYHSKCVTALEYGWQELCYNHYDPRWGLNAHDPRFFYEFETIFHYEAPDYLTILIYVTLFSLLCLLPVFLLLFIGYWLFYYFRNK